MFNIPEKYKLDIIIGMKDFIPKDMKAIDKQRIIKSVKGVKLTHQIQGEEIHSVDNDKYKCQTIQFYDIELSNIKDASYIAGIYQNIIKSLCVLRMYSQSKEIYSLSIKRIGQLDKTQIINEASCMTDTFLIKLPDSKKIELSEYISYDKIKNRTDKVNFYKEIYVKTYIITNKKALPDFQTIIDSNIWYDTSIAERVFNNYHMLVEKKQESARIVSNKDKAKLNQEIRRIIDLLEKEKYM